MDFDIYCDESNSDVLSSNKSKYSFMVIGGIWLPSQEKSAIKQDIKKIREAYGCYGEIKWNKVSNSKLDFYLALFDYFFSKDIRFRAIIVDKLKVDLIKYHKADAELGFYKFYYQLLHHWILDFNSYSIYIDLKTNKLGDRVKILKDCLQNSNITSDIKKMQALHSHEVIFIQLADLLTGAVSSKFNNSITSQAKQVIIKAIENHLKHEIKPTSRDIRKFNIFKINPKGGW
jgi:predicted ATP-binding protein involved in virulence